MKKVLKFLRDLLIEIVVAFLIAYLLTSFIFLKSRVDGKSMQPTLMDNDIGISFIIKKKIKIERFDICVLETDENKYIVKRVIGMPNDTIEYKDNQLYINDEYYSEDFLGDVTTNDFSITLTEDEYYCLGDNRDVSLDSRYYGPFSKDDFVSTGMFIFYPFENFGVKK